MSTVAKIVLSNRLQPIPVVASDFPDVSWNPTELGPDVAYITEYAGNPNIVVLEVEVSNASIEVGVLKSAHPVVDATVRVIPETGWTLVSPTMRRPWPDRWPLRRGTWRRYALYPTAMPELATEALNAALGIYRSVSRAYGPLEMPLPRLTLTQKIQIEGAAAGQLDAILNALEHGAPFVGEDTADSLTLFPGHGWRPCGDGVPYDFGGPGIVFSRGWQQNEKYARRCLLMAQSAHEMQWLAYRRSDGKPVTVEDYGAVTPQYSPDSSDPNNSMLPEFKDVADDLFLPKPDDFAHRIRTDSYLIVAAEQMGSEMAKRSIHGCAATVRLAYSERGPGTVNGYTPQNVKNWNAYATAYPDEGYGLLAGRTMGWPMAIVAESKKLGGGNRGDLDWAQAMEKFIYDGVMHSNYTLQRVTGSGPDDVWYMPGFDTAQSFEQPIFWYGACSIMRQFGFVAAFVGNAARELLSSPLRPYYNNSVGPYHFVAVAQTAGQPILITTGKGNGEQEGDATHMEVFAAIARHVTKRVEFLDLGAKVGVPTATWLDKMHSLQQQTDLSGTALYLAQCQQAL